MAGAGAIADERAGPFDWAGVVVGHWLVLGPAGADKHGRQSYRCRSRCGVVSPFGRSELAAGGTLTCEACRPGAAAPAGSRVTRERELAAHRAAWEGVVEERSNLKRDAVPEWEKGGREALLRFIDRTGLGRDFGWKAFVGDCHRRRTSDPSAEVRVRAYQDSTRRVDLAVTPAGPGLYWFEVSLATGRTDRPWAEVRRAIDAALAAGREPEVPPGGPAPPPAPPAPPETILGGLDVEKLLAMREGFDTLIAVGRDMKECEGMKRDAAASLLAARAAADPLRSAAEAAAAVAQRSLSDAEAAQDRAGRLHRELQEAVAERDRLAADAAAQVAARDRALSAYAPARDAVAAAERELADVERLEAERVKTLSKAGDVAVLLAALQKLGKAA